MTGFLLSSTTHDSNEHGRISIKGLAPASFLRCVACRHSAAAMLRIELTLPNSKAEHAIEQHFAACLRCVGVCSSPPQR